MTTKTITKQEADAAKKEIFALLLKKIDVALSSFYEAARNIFFWLNFGTVLCRSLHAF